MNEFCPENKDVAVILAILIFVLVGSIYNSLLGLASYMWKTRNRTEFSQLSTRWSPEKQLASGETAALLVSVEAPKFPRSHFRKLYLFLTLYCTSTVFTGLQCVIVL